MRTCQVCGKELHGFQQKYCGTACNHKAWQANRQRKCDDLYGVYKGDGFEKWVPKPRKRLLTDKQQRKIDRAIDEKTRLTFSSKHYKPGDPEFDAIAAQVTPLERVPTREYQGIFANLDLQFMGHRREAINILWGTE